METKMPRSNRYAPGMYEALRNAGIRSDAARHLEFQIRQTVASEVDTIRDEMRDHLMTKSDGQQLSHRMDELKAEIGQVHKELKAEIGQVHKELKAEIGQVHKELKAEIGQVRMELKSEIGIVRHELKGELHAIANSLTLKLLGGMVAMMTAAAAIIKLL